MTVTASSADLWVLAHRASWLRLLPIRANSRVRSRSRSARRAVQVRTRSRARRTSSESGRPAAVSLGLPGGALGGRAADLQPGRAAGSGRHGGLRAARAAPRRGGLKGAPPPHQVPTYVNTLGRLAKTFASWLWYGRDPRAGQDFPSRLDRSKPPFLQVWLGSFHLLLDRLCYQISP